MASRDEVKLHDVIQGNPDHDTAYGGLLLIVTAVKGWGVQASCIIPTRDGMREVPYRIPWEGFERIGPSAFVAYVHEDDV